MTFTLDPYGDGRDSPQTPPPRLPQPTIRGLGQCGCGRDPRGRDGSECRPRSGLGRSLAPTSGNCLRSILRQLERKKFDTLNHNTPRRDSRPPQQQSRPESPNESELVMSSVWWYVARSSGLVAWGLAALAVLWGLLLSTKVMGRKVRPNWLLDLHRFLGGLTVVFIAIHLVSLILDPYVDFGAMQILVPFASTWKPLAVAWGVVAFYLLLAVELTSLIRNRIPKRWWRAVHFSSYAIFVLGTVHLLTAGTDRHSPILLWTVAGLSTAVAAMTLYRIVTPKETRTIQSDTIRAVQSVG